MIDVRRIWIVVAALWALAVPAWAQSGTPLPVVPGYNSFTGCPSANLTPCFQQNVSGNASYPAGATPITGNATGTTGAVTGTLAAAAGKFTYVCGIHVDAIGGTAQVGPMTLAGIVGSSMVFQGSSTAVGNAALPTQTFWPCLPSSAVNTAITLTTTADGTASAVDVNMWGFQQ